ncbi:MAG: hypothetical protein ACI4L9_00535 [Candidatus Coproplasma sp.]
MENKETLAVEVEETAVAELNEQPEKKGSFGPKMKEWFRKQCVSLKRKPQKIAFLFFAITSVIYLVGLNTFSPAPVKDFSSQAYLGLSIFINTLFSILVLVLFMNSFPKRGVVNKKTGKKHKVNYVMLALTFVFIAAMFAFDIIYYVQLLGCIAGNESKFFSTMAEAQGYKAYWSDSFAANPVLNGSDYRSYLLASFQLDIVHMVFLGISTLLLVTLPLYTKLIMKIDTSKEIASSDLKEAIETQD